MKQDYWLVTGAASGIGKELVRVLLHRGERVLALDINEKALAQLSQMNEAHRGHLEKMCVDVRKTDQVKALLADFFSAGKRLSHVVFSAGIARSQWFQETRLEDFEMVMDVNFSSVIRLTHYLTPILEKQGFGHVTFISSVSGEVPAPFMTAYTSSKHALKGFARAYRDELSLKSSCVETLLVLPGFVNTQIIEKDLERKFPEVLKPFLSSPEAVAKEILSAIDSRIAEVVPTLNGKIMMKANRWLPAPLLDLSKKWLANQR